MQNLFQKKSHAKKSSVNNNNDDNIIIINDSPQPINRCTTDTGIMKFLVPIPKRNYAQDPFIPISYRSEESKRLEEEVEQKAIDKQRRMKNAQRLKQKRAEKAKKKNRLLSLGLDAVKARRSTYSISQKKEVAAFVQNALKMKWRWIEIQNVIQESQGFEKVTYPMAQRWYSFYALDKQKAAKKRGVKPNAEFEAAVINKLFIN